MGYLIKMRKRLGKFFLFWGGNTPFLVIADPTSVRQILSDNKSFIKGDDYQKAFALAFGQGLVTSNSEKHRRDRFRFFLRFVNVRFPLMFVFLFATCTDTTDTTLASTSFDRTLRTILG